MPSYVVGASIGGGLGVLLVGYAWYLYVQHKQEEKEKALRKVAFFAKQAVLVAESHAEIERYLQQEAALKAEKREEKRLRELHKAEKAHRQRQYRGGGAYAVGPMRVPAEACAHAPQLLSDESSSVVISSLHTSERSAEDYFSNEDTGSEFQQGSETFESEQGSDHFSSDQEEEEEEEESGGSSLNSSDLSAFADDMMSEIDTDSSQSNGLQFASDDNV